MNYIEGLKLGGYLKVSLKRFALTYFPSFRKNMSLAKSVIVLKTLEDEGKVSYEGRGIYRVI